MSHAGNQSAVMLSSKYNVGIDLEEMSDKIFAVAPRFLNQNEKNSIQTETARPHLYAYWCMKEALYKLYGKKGLDFSKNIFIHPFVFAMAGKCQAVIQKAGYEKNFSVSYRSTEKFMLAYVEDRQDFLHHNS
jgi:phosphopantetheinyl transferase